MRALDTVLYVESRLIGTLSPLSSYCCIELDCLVSLTAAADPPFSTFFLSGLTLLVFSFGSSGGCIQYDIAIPICALCSGAFVALIALEP